MGSPPPSFEQCKNTATAIVTRLHIDLTQVWWKSYKWLIERALLCGRQMAYFDYAQTYSNAGASFHVLIFQVVYELLAAWKLTSKQYFFQFRNVKMFDIQTFSNCRRYLRNIKSKTSPFVIKHHPTPKIALIVRW